MFTSTLKAMRDLKFAFYIAAAVAVFSMFFYTLRPYLLETPPNATALALLALVIASMLYFLIVGPVWLVRVGRATRKQAQRILNIVFRAFLASALIGFFAPVPFILPAAFACYALVALLLRATARYAPLNFV
jgi:hypothetical protein